MDPETTTLVVNLVLVVLTGLATLGVRALTNMLGKNARAKDFEAFDAIIRAAVVTAEALGYVDAAVDKRAEAIAIAERRLAEAGIVVDLDIIADAVEQAVFEEFNRYRREREAEEARWRELNESVTAPETDEPYVYVEVQPQAETVGVGALETNVVLPTIYGTFNDTDPDEAVSPS